MHVIFDHVVENRQANGPSTSVTIYTFDPLDNAYRFNAKRWDEGSQSDDMDFRDYSPVLNRFTSRDSYNGALSDMRMSLDPWTGNRYAFAGAIRSPAWRSTAAVSGAISGTVGRPAPPTI